MAFKIYNGSIDLSKINKNKIATKNKNGEPFPNGAKYYPVKVIIFDEENEYGSIGGISEQQTKEERESKEKENRIANLKLAFDGSQRNSDSGARQSGNQSTTPPPPSGFNNNDSDDLPF